MDDKEVVSAIRASLADKVEGERFDLWLAPARLLLCGESLIVELPNQFSQDWVRRNFRATIETACSETLGHPLAVEFRINPALARRICSDPTDDRDGSVASLPEKSSPGKLSSDTASDTAIVEIGAADKAVGGSPPSIAIHGTRPHATTRKFATLDRFVVGESNRLAHASAQMVAEQPGRVSPLLVYGPTAVGKTHLLEGIWAAARKKRPGLHAVYLSAEQFTTYFIDALNNRSGLPNFRRKYRGVELLIVDGLQFFAGKRATIGELLHTTDTLLRDGKQLVFAADRAAGELRHLGDDLVTRLSSGLSCAIDPPDFATRLGILRQLADSRGLNLADDVASFIATNLTSHARELSGAVNRLDAAARMLHKPITLSMAEDSLADMIRHHSRTVRLADIDKAVCEVMGLDAESLQSGERRKAISQPRMLAMFLARKHTRAALSEIGRHFGRRSHSTVLSAKRTVGHWLAHQSTFEHSGRRWKVEDTIRQIECRLQQA